MQELLYLQQLHLQLPALPFTFTTISPVKSPSILTFFKLISNFAFEVLVPVTGIFTRSKSLYATAPNILVPAFNDVETALVLLANLTPLGNSISILRLDTKLLATFSF